MSIELPSRFKHTIISDGIRSICLENPSKVAYKHGHKTRTYAELTQRMGSISGIISSSDIPLRSNIAIVASNSIEYMEIVLASSQLGHPIATVNPKLTATEIVSICEDAEAKLIFVDEKVSSLLKETEIKGIKRIIDIDNEMEDLVDQIDYQEEIPTVKETETFTIPYTSGTTGKPKGVVHTHGGFSVFAGHQASYLINMGKEDRLFWPADIGWITGLVWNVYGLLLVGSSAVIYDGALDFPNPNRVWEILSKYQATIFGISPTAVRLFKKINSNPRNKYSLDSLQNIPTTGEPLDEDSWWWLFENVGNKKIPIMNLSGGTEIGGAMLSVFPGMKLKPSTVGIPVPGMNLDVVNDDGESVTGQNGYLVIKSPWPGMTRGLLNDDQRYIETYWSKFENIWFHGDYVLKDEDNLWYMQGRTDDVINVSGHRMSTAEIEHTVISHKKISDAASIAIPDEITGEAIVVFFVAENKDEVNLENEIMEHISKKIGKIAKPRLIIQLTDLPKTRTGKIMRRLLKSKIMGKPLGDLSSLENPHILNEIQKIN